MWVDERFVFYCVGLVCGFVLFECLRAFEVWRRRHLRSRKIESQGAERYGSGYRRAVDIYRGLPGSKVR